MKNSIKYFFIFFFISTFLISCDSSTSINDDISIDYLYNKAVIDAMIADSSEISHNLIPVVKDNEFLTWKTINNKDYVLAATYTKYNASYPLGDTVELKWGNVWISMAPELRNRISVIHYSNDSLLSLRIHQLLGLPFKYEKKYFVEFWVSPDDMFRPSADSEITDNTAGLYFPANVSVEYKQWFNENIISSYFPGTATLRYPWTRLGYTYDWGNPKNEFGVSEFIVKKGAKVIVENVKTQQEYFVK